MNIIHTLTLRQLKKNKTRTLVTIIGIILSVSMITAVPSLAVSFMKMMQDNEIENTGDWHAYYNYVPSQKIDTIINNKHTAFAALTRDIGFAKLEGSQNEGKPYLFITSYDEQAIKSFHMNLIKGRLPSKDNEILISSHIADNGGVIYKIGDTIKLDVGQRYVEEDGEISTLDQSAEFQETDEYGTGETFVAESSMEYTITGIISRPTTEPYWAPGYTVITYLDKDKLKPSDSINIWVKWNKVSKKVNEQTNQLAKEIDVSVDYNEGLLRYSGLIRDEFLTILYCLSAFVIILIMIGSISLIYNSFAISIAERSRYLGMLASVGATKKQKRSSVWFESFVVGIIGIPIGILCGLMGLQITFILMQPLMKTFMDSDVKLTLSAPPTVILVAILFSILTITISAYLPAKRSSRISPMDAIRQTQDLKLKSKNVKTSKLTRLIFGFEAELGLKNLKRNKRRYKSTIFSLVISIVLFLSVSSLSFFTQKSTELALQDASYDVRVMVTSSATAEDKMGFYTGISKLEYIDEYAIQQKMYTSSSVDSHFLQNEFKKILEQICGKSETYSLQFTITSVDELALKKYAKESGVDIHQLKDTKNPCGILFNTVSIQENKKYKRFDRFQIHIGEKIECIPEESDISISLEIAALGDTLPMGATTLYDTTDTMIIVSEEVYESIYKTLPEDSHSSNNYMYLKSSNPAKLVERIKEYQSQTSIANIDIYDIAASEKADAQLYTFIYTFFYGFVALITAICVANILNTISTSISLRKMEFAMLKSIGITPKGFNKMIRYESLFYGIKALLYGLPISFFNMYLIYYVFRGSFEFAFTIPWSSVIICIIAVFAVVSSTMIFSSSKIKKMNIIDALKDENI